MYYQHCLNTHFLLVDRDVGSITIACLYPSATSQPLWLPKHNGFNEPAGPLIGDHSVSETVPGVEWSLTIGVTEEGPLLAGDQMNVRAYSRQAEAGRGYFRIDVRGKNLIDTILLFWSRLFTSLTRLAV